LINTITVSGNLGRDVELRYTPADGIAVAQFTLANSVGYGDKKHTNWINCVAWRNLGENCAKYLEKGSKAIVTGELRIRDYEKDGQKRFVTEVICRDVEFISRKNERQAGDDGLTSAATEIFDGEDVPF
jgi:single-strand DNA-binding protein